MQFAKESGGRSLGGEAGRKDDALERRSSVVFNYMECGTKYTCIGVNVSMVSESI